MKTKNFPEIFIWLVMFVACSKGNSINNVPLSTTSLKIIVTDNAGYPVSNASVKLYLSKNNLDSQINQIGNTLITDENGIVTFIALRPAKYYWYAQKDCLDNYNGFIGSSNMLVANVTNTAHITLFGNGHLKLVNTSSDPYKIYINGILAVNDLSGKTFKTIMKVPTGLFTIRVIQLSGFRVAPVDKVFTGNLTCGNTVTTTFP
jgi:hypothetical protein